MRGRREGGGGGERDGGDGDGRGLDAAVGGLVDGDGDDRRRSLRRSSFSFENRGEERRVRAGCCQSLEGLESLIVEGDSSSSSSSSSRVAPLARSKRRPGQRRRERVGGQQRRDRVAGRRRALLFFLGRGEIFLGDPEGVDGPSGEALGVRDDCFYLFIFWKKEVEKK